MLPRGDGLPGHIVLQERRQQALQHHARERKGITEKGCVGVSKGLGLSSQLHEVSRASRRSVRRHRQGIGNRSDSDGLRNNPQQDGGLTAKALAKLFRLDRGVGELVLFVQQGGQGRPIAAEQSRSDSTQGCHDGIEQHLFLAKVVLPGRARASSAHGRVFGFGMLMVAY